MAIEMSTTTSAQTITVIRRLFPTYSLPEQLVSDNGPQFTLELSPMGLNTFAALHIIGFQMVLLNDLFTLSKQVKKESTRSNSQPLTA